MVVAEQSHSKVYLKQSVGKHDASIFGLPLNRQQLKH